MNYQEMKQKLESIQSLLGGISIPANRQYIGVLAQVYYLLDSLRDECDSCAYQEAHRVQESQLDEAAASQEGI